MNRATRRLLLLLACAAVAWPALIAEFRAPLNADAAWLLYSAGRLLRGEHLYTDILEINPPLIVWLNVPVALVNRLFDVPPALGLRCAILLAATLSILACLRVLGRYCGLGPAGLAIAAVALTFVCLPLVGGIFGQREQVALLLTLPYVSLVAARALGAEPTPGVATSLGVLGGIGFAIKPHYVLVWLFLVVTRSLYARRVRVLPEDFAVIGLGSSYLLAVVLFTPAYFAFVGRNVRDYLAFGARPLAAILFDDSPAFGWYVGLVMWLVLRRVRTDPIGATLAACGAGYLAAIALQHKGWSYHYYPLNAMAVLLATHTVASELPSLRLSDRSRVLRRAALGIYAALLLIFGGVVLGASWRRARGPLSDREAREVAIVHAVREQTGARSLVVLSSQQRDGALLGLESGLDWRPGYPALWVPLVHYRSYAGPSRRVGYRRPEEMGPPERAAYERVIREFVSQSPDVLVLESPALNERRTQYPGGFDYLRYFGQDSAFAARASRYLPAAEVAGLIVLRKRA